jgi:hypothetical protein
MRLACTLVLLVVSAFAAERNGVGNAGFENGMESWDTAGGPDGIAIDDAVAHSGKRSVRVTGATGGVHQFIPFSQSFQHPVRVSGWSKALGVEGEAYVMWLDGEYADGTKIARADVDFDKGTHDWQQREFTFDPLKPLKSLELVAVKINGKGTVWFDDLAVTLAPFSFRGIKLTPDSGVVADLTVNAPWKAELRGPSGVVASAQADGPPVQLQWLGRRGSFTLRLSATDALREETIDEVRKVNARGATSDLAAWVESSMHRVMPQALPGAAKEARIALAGNEYESFQICLLSGKPVKGVRIETGDLIAKNGKRIPASEIEWRQVGYVDIEYPRKTAANQGTWAGWWPDPLLPVAKFDLQVALTQPVWITVHAAAGTAAGEYSGAVRVIVDGQTIHVPLRVKVYGFSLPAENHLKTAFALLGEQLESIYGKPVGTQLRQAYGDFLLKHRLNADDIYRMTAPDPDDVRHFRERGLNAFNLLYLIPQNGYPELKSYTPELKQTLLDRLGAPIPKLREAGLSKQAYVYGFDELDPEFFPVMRDYFGEIKRRYPEVHTMTTAHIPLDPKTLKDLNVDWIVPVTDNYDFDKAEDCRRAGLQVWGYVSLPREHYATFLADDPLIQARVLMWQAWQQKMDGFLYWGMNIWDRRGNRRPIDLTRGPLLDWGVTTGKETDEQWLRELNGDGQLLYPVANGPIGSIRLENLRDGLEDYEYLWMTGKRDAGLAVAKDLTHFTLDPAVVYAQRERIAREIASHRK